MRETEIRVERGPVRVLLLAVLAVGFGCKSQSGAQPEAAEQRAKQDPTSPSPSTQAEADEPREQAKPEAEADPERADKLADLDAMCKALDHDYVDGTLTDYYRDIEPRTDWGKAQRDAGNESIKPGRLLEQAVAELSPGAKDPALTNCRKLLDYLDDVE